MKKKIHRVCDKLPWNSHFTGERRCICHGFNLDIGCGPFCQAGFLGMDIRPLPEVAFIHDIESRPWPFPDNSVDRLLASHILEHIEPKHTIPTWDELWRVMKKTGQMLVSVPHGMSYGMFQDPTHNSFYVDMTFAYFCPEDPSNLYSIYQPKPWRMVKMNSYQFGNIEAVMIPLK